MKSILPVLLFLLTVFESYSQKKELVYLWPGKVPDKRRTKYTDI